MEEGAQELRLSEFPILEIANSNHYVVNSHPCYGLFCFRNFRNTGQDFLLNPLRGEVLMLPPKTVTPHKDFYGVGFDCTTETYKVVRVFPRKYENNLPHDLATQVYTLGTRSWRHIRAAPPCSCFLRECEWAISAYGDVHWVGYSRTSCEDMIISFDTRKEEFKLTPHPKLPTKLVQTFHLIDLRGHLAMIDHSLTTHVEVWLLKDYDKKEWAIEYRISTQLLFGNQRIQTGMLTGIGAWEHGILFYKLGYNLDYYNPKTDSVKRISFPPNVSSFHKGIIGYKGSLVSLKNSGNMVARVAYLRNYIDLSTAGLVPVFR